MRKNNIAVYYLSILLGIMIGNPLRGAVRPAAIFQNHAVLQAGKPLPVWGQADAGEKITVSFAGQTASTTSRKDGPWKVSLAPLKVSSIPAVLTIQGKNTITLQDILVGEVWLCSGQSNMEFALPNAREGAAEVAAANYPTIRQFIVRKNVTNTPQATARSQWDVCTPQNAVYFTAVGYFFTRELYQNLGIPIGIINSTWGGTEIEPWMSADSVSKKS